MKSHSTIKPIEPFHIEHINKNLCYVHFVDSVVEAIDEEGQATYSYNHYLYETRPIANMEQVISNNIEPWLAAAKKPKERPLKEVERIMSLETQGISLLQSNWEMDDRIYEVEWTLEEIVGTPMKLSLTTTSAKFEQAKTLIEAGAYDRTTMQPQLEKYAKRGIITQEECDILIAMMDEREGAQTN